MGYSDRREVSVLRGKTLTSVRNVGDEKIVFETSEGISYEMQHHQDCCESVRLEDVIGDLSDLVGSPLLLAEEVSEEPEPGKLSDYDESFTWTFYKFATIKGSVTLRWYGTSNGYYSERVDFEEG